MVSSWDDVLLQDSSQLVLIERQIELHAEIRSLLALYSQTLTHLDQQT